MKVMITKGLKGRKNLEQYHEDCRMAVLARLSQHYDIEFTGDILHFKHIENFDYSNPKHRLQSLINTLQSELMIADVVVFMDNWYDFAGCCIEHEICRQYGIKIEYINSESQHTVID